MECVGCQFDNREGAKFCKNCGTRLEFLCPSCGHSCDTDSSFCDECGETLGRPAEKSLPKDLSFEEKLSQIQRFLPKGLTEKVLSQRGKIEGERRQVTIMFVDMKGFTPLTEKLGPEETFSLMEQVYEIMIHEVHEYEGTVNELRGDGILALFGAPVALEDGPQRAIRASLAMHRGMVKFSEKVKAERGLAPILLRIGINTGPVVLGTLGNDLRVQFTAVGDTINMAARMEQIAEPGTTYVAEETFRLTEGFFRFEALGEKQVKGKEDPMSVYQVIAPSSRRTRFDVSAERGLTGFVGRERELELLIDGFDRAKSGRGQAFSLVAEAGVGKSRLLYEFRKAVANEDALFLEGKCLSYSRGTAYHPIIDILKAIFDIQDEDESPTIIVKVKKGLEILGADETSTLPYLLELLSVKDSGIDKIQMSPEGKKDRIIQAIKGVALKGSERKPLIMAIEDLHWMDKSSEDVAKYLLESIPGARILLIFTFRPEFVQTWGGKSFHSQVTLNRLSNRESLAMVSRLLGTDHISEDLEDLILEKTEGVPFFVEEFVRSLNDLGVIERRDNWCGLARDIDLPTIPSTIHDLIMARVDSLPEGPKEVLQAGSVIEREFGYELIKAVTGLPEQELLTRLSILKDSEHLYERGIYPDCVYIFRHALTREVIYESILPKRRRRLHEQIAAAIETVFSENLSDYYGILAEHYLASENYEKAAEALHLAGKRAVRKGSLREAIAHGKRGISALEKLPLTDRVEESLIDARMMFGQYHLQINRFADAYHAVEPVVDLAAKRNNPKQLSTIYTFTGTYHAFAREDFERGLKDLKSAVELSEAAQGTVSYILTNVWLGVSLYLMACDFENALNHLQKALQMADGANNLWGISLIKSNIAMLRYHQGTPSLGLEMSAEGVRLAEQSGDIFSKFRAYVSHGLCLYGRGLLKEASDNLSRGAELSGRVEDLLWNANANWHLAEISCARGDSQKAVWQHEEAYRLMKRSELFPSWRTLGKTGLALANIMNGSRDVDLESMCRDVIRSKPKFIEGWIRRNLGEILLNINDQHGTEARYWIEEAIEADQRNGMRFHLARDYALYAELFKRKGNTFKAKEQLGKAIEIYKECGADGWVTKAEEELARLS